VAYESATDLTEKRQILSALSSSRLPWLLKRFSVGQNDSGLSNKLDLFAQASLLSKNPLGRKITWDKFREDFQGIESKYGQNDPRLAQVLIEIFSSFENEFLYQEVSYLKLSKQNEKLKLSLTCVQF
jgi:hypothetical protein